MKRMLQGMMLCMCIAAMVAGCAKPEKMDMAHMKNPPRPAELDQLDPWVGNWTMTGECTMGDQKMTNTGTSTIAWDCDRWALVEHMTGKMGEMNECGMVVYTWCPKKKNFKTFYCNNMGETSKGEMSCCDKCKGWCMKGKGANPMSGETMIFEGCVKMPDNNTMEFEWSMWDGMHLKKMAYGKGTAKRS
jgi:hypothetical protein